MRRVDLSFEWADKRKLYLFAASKRFNCSLPRFTASSSAALASFLPDHTDFELFVDDVADLHEVADAQALGVLASAG